MLNVIGNFGCPKFQSQKHFSARINAAKPTGLTRDVIIWVSSALRVKVQ